MSGEGVPDLLIASAAQAQHAQFKQESEERISAAAAEAEALRSQLGEAQQEAAKAEREQREATAALHAREEELAAELTRSKARCIRRVHAESHLVLSRPSSAGYLRGSAVFSGAEWCDAWSAAVACGRRLLRSLQTQPRRSGRSSDGGWWCDPGCSSPGGCGGERRQAAPGAPGS